MNTLVKNTNYWKKSARIFAKTVLYIVLFVLVLLLLVQLPFVQNILRQKAVAYLERKLETKVSIRKVHIGFPRDVVLEDVYIEDRNKDTLLSGGTIKADLDIWKLAFKQELIIESVSLENITARVSRQLPGDTSYNFQFIVDAFTPKDTSTTSDTSASAITLGAVEMDNVRLLYNDVVTGNNMEAWVDHLDTHIDVFDPQRLNFDVPETNISGLTASIRQTKPLATPEPAIKDSIEAVQPIAMMLAFDNIDLEKINITYQNDISAIHTSFMIGSLKVTPRSIDLTSRMIDLEELSLENSITNIRLGQKEQARVVINEVKQEAAAQSAAGWTIRVGTIDLENNNFRFDNDNEPRLNYGMDYAHIKADTLSLHAKDVVISTDSIEGLITRASFKEQSGFVLQKLETSFLYTNQQITLDELYLQTPGSELKRKVAIRYASPEALMNDIANMEIDLNLEESKLLVKDLLTFVPELRRRPAFAYPNATWYVNSRITGRVANLKIDVLQVEGLQDTRIDLSGHITGLPDINRFKADLNIRNIASSKRDISLFVPTYLLPNNITIPAQFNLHGNLRSDGDLLNTDIAINSSLGNATVKGTFHDVADPARSGYNATINANRLDLGTILQNKEIRGPISATVTANGTGYDPKTANAKLKGTIHSAIIKDYTYKGLVFDGTVASQQAVFNTSISEPNIDFDLLATADLSKTYPALQITGMIDSIKLQPLHLANERMIYRGKIDADFPVTNPDDLQGRLFFTQSLFVQNDQRLQLDTVELVAARTDSGHSIRLNSDVMTVALEGEYQLTELGNILTQAIQPYFAIRPGAAVINTTPYDFTLNAYILDNPALKVFVPGLEKIDSVSLQSHFSNTGWTATVNASSIDMGPNHLRDLKLQAGTGNNAIEVNATLAQFSMGKDIRLDNTTLNASIANNNIDFVVNNKDRNGRDKYNIRALLRQPVGNSYEFSINPDSLLLNYDSWAVTGNNKITITPAGVNATNLVLSRSGQHLSINSLSAGINAPMDVNFSNFRLATLTGFIQSDSNFVNGTMNGKITFTDLAKEPVFTGDLRVDEFSFKGDTVGNIHALINNRQSPDTYAADITLNGRGNDVKFAGNYYVRPTGSNYDFDLDIRSLAVATIQAFSNNAISGASGAVNGNFDVSGTLDKPSVKGDLNFDKARFNLAMLNSSFNIDQEKIRVDDKGLHFDRFQIKDSAQNALVINGIAATNNFFNYAFDLDVRANNFRALNSTKRHNSIFYGQLYFNTNLKVKGTEAAPVVDGRLVVNDKTKMTVVIPQAQPGIVEREGVIEFVDMDAPLNDSLFMAAYDSLNRSVFTGMDIAVNVEIVPEAEFNIIIDEGNGDFLKVKGEALLTCGIDPSGKINLSGSYELNEGSYELTFNFLRRRFEIQKGSRIVWEGEPTEANMDVEAIYIANTAPLDLVKDQMGEVSAFERNTYLQKLPFDVHLKMEGKLLQPNISFDIVLPDNRSYAVSGDIVSTVRTRLEQLRQEPGEMNKQVFSLLLLNRFVAENPFNSSTGGPNAGVLARQSVSKLLTEQLNRLAGDLIAGVDLNFDVTSAEDYTTGQRENKTDLNVGLSKRLLNDRLTVTVGSNFELEGPQNSSQGSNIAGNVALDYRISKDNRYLLRAYRKNEYEGAIDGYIIETGVGFIITVDYNRFRELFVSRKQRQERRERRQKQREIDRQQQQNTTPATDSIPPPR
jgi:translocation and assembly module TamB